MSYCPSCGNYEPSPGNYCRNCGQPLSARQPAPAATGQMASLADQIASGYEEGKRRERLRWNKVQAHNEGLEIYLGCIGMIALLRGTDYIVGGQVFGSLLNGALGWILVAGLLSGAALKIYADLRLGTSALSSITQTLLFGALLYVLMFGSLWALKTSVLQNGKALFDVTTMFPRSAVHPTATPLRR